MPESSMLAVAIDVVNKSIQTVKKLRDIDLKMQTAEYKDALADLLTDMAELKIKLVEVQEENLKLKKIIAGQDQKGEIRKAFKLIRNTYFLESELYGYKPGYYCQHCFEGTGELKVLTPFGIYFLCSSCKGRFN